MVALTPAAICALMAVPSAKVSEPTGIVTVGSAPPNPGGGLPAALLTINAPIAPAFCMVLAFTAKVQVPRSATPIAPAMELAGSGSQASDVTPTPSFARTRFAVTVGDPI